MNLRTLSAAILQESAAILQDDAGQNLIEYALIAFLIGLAAVTAMTSLSNKIMVAYTTVNSMLVAAT